MPSPFARAARPAAGALLLAALLPGVPAARAAAAAQTPAQPAAQTGTVRGRITDAGTQRPIPDAQVGIEGTTLGAVTNANGEYVIARVPAGARQVRVRRIGFGAVTRPVTVAVGADARLDIAVQQAAAQLDEVVVTTGGAATTRRTIGNAITTINAAEVTQQNSISTVAEVLQSKTPGVTILPGSGTPGTAGEIRIRGNNSLSGSRPVIFIDGIRMSNEGLGNFNPTGSGTTGQAQSSQITSGLDFVNPEDIESIEVIKGPAAATLYGADASAGVIQIITKRGARGQQRPQYSARGELGSNEWALPTLVNYLTCDSARIAARSTVDGQSVPTYTGCQGKAIGTVLTQDPMRLDPNALRTGGIQRLNLGLRGGSDRFSYFVSGDRDDEYGVFFNSFNHRKAGRANFTLAPNDKTDLAFNVSYAQNDLRLPAQDESVLSILLNSSRSQPGLRPQTAARTAFVGGDTIVYSLLTAERSNNYNNRTTSDRLQLGATLNYNPLSWFRNRLTVGTDQLFSTADVLVLPGDDFEPIGGVTEQTPRTRIYTVDYNASFPYRLTSALEGTSQVGTQVIARRNERLTASGTGLGAPDVTVIGSAQTTSGSNTFSENNSVGYYVQQQVGYQNRLFLTGAVRADDNSSFGTNFDLIVYPKLSFSYVASEEPALRQVFNALGANSFKLRGAWGQAGRAPEPYSATQTYQIIRSTLSQTNTASGLITNSYGNPGLKPERGEEFEAGFESSHFGNRVGVDFTYYNRRTRDMLVPVAVAPSLGFISSPITNLGTVRNSGVELALTAAPVTHPRFAWDTRVNLSTNNDRLESFGIPGRTSDTPSGQAYGVVQQHRVGYRLGAYWAQLPLRNADGTPRLNAAGTAVLLDTATYIGPSAPTRELGFGNTFTFFRNFRVYALLDYKGGHYLFNAKERSRCQAVNDNCARNNDPRVRFPKTAADTLLSKELAVWRAVPAAFIDKADFVKLREVSLGVTLPQRLARRVRASQAQFVLSGRNLALWSDYDGLDPEVNSYGGRNFVRVDAYANPQARRIAGQFNITF